jgi:hypothetical protein
MLLLSMSLSLFSIFKGTAVGIRSILKIQGYLNKMQQLNKTTMCDALKSEKTSQNREKMAIEYQPDFSDESAEDTSLDKKIGTTHIFLDFRGNIEKMETSLPNGTVLKSTPEKNNLN